MIKVLHVDDEPSFLELVTFFLNREGDFEIVTSVTAKDAIEKLKEQGFDAIVADYSLPEINGIDLLKILRAQGNDIPFILLTGKGREEVAAEALSNGADLYLQKGANPQLQFATLAHVIRQSVRRRRSEIEGRETEHFLAAIFNSIQDGISVLDKEFNILKVNPTMEKWYAQKAPLAGKKCYEAYYGRDTSCQVCPYRETLKSGKASNETVSKVGPKGEVIGWLDLFCFPIMDSKTGELTGVIEYVRDITDRRKAEDALREHDNQLRKLSLHVPGMIYQFTKRLDGTYCVPFTTDAIKEIFGCSPQDVREDFSPIAKAILPEDFDKVVRSIEYSAEHMTLWQCEYRVQIPDQPVRWVFGQSTPEKLEDGSILWHGFNTDITERKLAEEMLRTSEERYRQLVDLAQEGIMVTDAEAIIQFANPRMVDMLGYHADEVVGKPAFQFMNEQASELARRKFEDRKRGLTGRYELDFLRKDGALVRTNIGVTPIKDKDGGFLGSLAVVTDITDRKRYEETLKLANQKLNLLGRVTRHDALNQMAVLMGWLQIVQVTVTEPPASEHLAAILKAALAIQKDLEFTADYESVGGNNPIWVDVDRACRQGVSVLNLEGIIVTIDLDGVEVLADQMLDKVFHNLADNSMRHGKKVTKIWVGYEESKDGLTLTYEDDGVGIAKVDKERVFGRGEGMHTGHGLDLIKGILDITHIKISETGTPGKGARFELFVTPGNYRIAPKNG
jgi:PAS domain S-box-containing protein